MAQVGAKFLSFVVQNGHKSVNIISRKCDKQKVYRTFFVYVCKITYLCRIKKGMSRRGRNKELIRKRDDQLCRRYYYWTEKQRLRFDDALRILSEQEFFISEERIMAIIRRHCHELKDIDVKPVPKVKKPRLIPQQLELFEVQDANC